MEFLSFFIPTIAANGHSHGGGSLTDVSDEWPTWSEIFETMALRAGHNTNTVILGTVMLGIAAGVVGVFALLRKRSLMTDALSHATLPGIALAFLVAAALGAEGRSLPVLLVGATLSGALGVVCIQAIIRFTRLREDAAIGIVLSVFFGAGIVGLSYIQANAASGAAGLNKFIYGQTAAMGRGDAILMACIAALAVVAALVLLKEFAIVCFNDAFAKVDGWPVSLIDLAMMSLVVVVTVAGLQAVGLILVVAMLIIPSVAARFWTDRLWLLVVLAALIGGASGYFGSVVSALLPRKPAGAVIVLTAGAIFAISLVFAPQRGALASLVRRVRLRIRFAGEHLLEFAYERGGAELSEADITSVARLRAWPFWMRPIVVRSILRRGQAVRSANALLLTDEGLERGARISRNHKLWEQYLTSYADIAPSHVDWSVDQVEHVLSDELIAELEAQLAARGIVVPAPTGERAAR